MSAEAQSNLQKATFAAGCFWSVELVFQREPGVVDTSVGYTGGSVKNPTYEAVCSGRTGHAEAVQVTFDPSQVSYGRLLSVFFDKHDPTQLNRQGNDSGSQYRSAIFYHSEEQRTQAQEKKAEVQKSYKAPVVTEIAAFKEYFPAEEYHQRYLEKGGQCAIKGDKTKIQCYG
jgi:peptide-methionine (S)-S-oxide reductase